MIVRGLSQVKVKKETKQIKSNIKADIKDIHDPKLSPKRGYGFSD